MCTMCPSHMCATESIQNSIQDSEVNDTRWQEWQIDAKLKELIFISLSDMSGIVPC